jgi:hypothetical protein
VTAEGAPKLREMLLASKPSDYAISPTTELPHVWAVLMEMPVGAATASLIAVADGATSMYFSTGGGIIGGQAHESVRTANHTLLVMVEKLLRGFVVKDAPLPVVPGAISFVVLTHEGLRVARDTEDRLKTKKSPLWPVFFLGHAVIAELRKVSAKPPGA